MVHERELHGAVGGCAPRPALPARPDAARDNSRRAADRRGVGIGRAGRKRDEGGVDRVEHARAQAVRGGRAPGRVDEVDVHVVDGPREAQLQRVGAADPDRLGAVDRRAAIGHVDRVVTDVPPHPAPPASRARTSTRAPTGPFQVRPNRSKRLAACKIGVVTGPPTTRAPDPTARRQGTPPARAR